MPKTKKIIAPTYTELILPVYRALLGLGGSGTNDEICDKVVSDLKLTDEAVDESHLGSDNQTELEYQLAWARTYLKNYGVIINSARSVWSSQYVYAYWSKYQTNCPYKNNNLNGKVFEAIIATELYRKNIRPFYLQAKVTFVRVL